jgi:hypothetical protein
MHVPLSAIPRPSLPRYVCYPATRCNGTQPDFRGSQQPTARDPATWTAQRPASPRASGHRWHWHPGMQGGSRNVLRRTTLMRQTMCQRDDAAQEVADLVEVERIPPSCPSSRTSSRRSDALGPGTRLGRNHCCRESESRRNDAASTRNCHAASAVESPRDKNAARPVTTDATHTNYPDVITAPTLAL